MSSNGRANRETAEAVAYVATEDDCRQALDTAFLNKQTFGDAALQRELLALFMEQSKRIVGSLHVLGDREQRDVAHLLVGSARSIGAWPAGQAAEDFGRRDFSGRAAALPMLRMVFEGTIHAIEQHIAGMAP